MTANMWRGLPAGLDPDVPRVGVASRDSQAFCYRTGLLALTSLCPEQLHCLLQPVHEQLSAGFSFLQADKGGGAVRATEPTLPWESSGVHVAAILITLECN